jgi:membrane-bound lytic murein transglycosylase A
MTHIGGSRPPTRSIAQRRRLAVPAAAVAALLAGCAVRAPAPPPPPPAPALPALGPPQAPAQLPGWATDPLDGLGAAIGRQCVERMPPAPWPALCAEWRTLGGASAAAPGLRGWLEARFVAWPLRAADGETQGLVTGYYEPLLDGSRTRETATQVPLFARPDDLLTVDLAAVEPRLSGLRLRGRLDGRRVVPYHSRAEIETGGPLAGRELLWVDDRVDAFFLEIQGSGRVRLRDGRVVRVGYADQNGHPYRAIGRTLIERGALARDEVSAPAIRRWLRENPAEAATMMQTNPSVVFFRELPPPPEPAPGEPEAGPPGSLGVPLTALRSIAVDRSVVPLGSLVWLDTVDPLDGSPLQRAVAAQDTGGAITGRVRADLFWGFGPRAEEAAGRMRTAGRMWLLWPSGERPPGAPISR